ncbi:UNVERIFIED_CONTAM: hypothetical protein HDU68_001446 [Siphonaria sp. JEL0065]|nr:hypothetical protein HDU68_001446 [Siphonaria sp. JEL0065]
MSNNSARIQPPQSSADTKSEQSTDIESRSASAGDSELLKYVESLQTPTIVANETLRQKDFETSLQSLLSTELAHLKNSSKATTTCLHVAECAAFTLKSDIAILDSQNKTLQSKVDSIPMLNKEITLLETNIRNTRREANIQFQSSFVWDEELDGVLRSADAFGTLMKELKEVSETGIFTSNSRDINGGISVQEWVASKLDSLKRKRVHDESGDYKIGGRFFRPRIELNATIGDTGSIEDGTIVPIPRPQSVNGTTPKMTFTTASKKQLEKTADGNRFGALQSMAILSTARVAGLKEEFESLVKKKAEKEEKYRRLLEMSSTGGERGKSLESLAGVLLHASGSSE